MKRDFVALIVSTTCLAVTLDPWIDLMRRWRPLQNSNFYRLDLPGPDRLQVSLVKHGGGNHNRIWEIQVRQRATDQISNPLKLDAFTELADYPAKSSQDCLTTRYFVGATDRFFNPQPGIWVRPTGNTWVFLSFQGIGDASAGPIEIVPRNNFNPGDAVEYGEGYFTWRPGMAEWIACR